MSTILNRINSFYEYFFLINYRHQKTVTSDPKIFPTFVVSFCQTINLFLILVIIYFVTDLQPILTDNFLKYSFTILFIIFGAFNFYQYIIREKEIDLIKENEISKLTTKGFYFLFILSNFYVLVSMALPLMLIYYFKEHY